MENKNKFNVKNFIKIDSSATRLQSLRLPRDLSLGGTKVKKNYKPNLNVVRSKSEKLKGSHKIPSKKNKFEVFRNTSNRNKDRFVQSAGVFSEGINHTCTPIANGCKGVNMELRKKTSVYNKLPENTDIIVMNVDKPKPIVDATKTYIKNEDSGTDDDNEKESFTPIKWDESSASCYISDFKNETINYFLTNNQKQATPKLSLWQLPDSFSLRKEKGTSTSLNDCRLVDMPQGNIGKMQIRKSGRVDIYIANCKYEIDFSCFGLNIEELSSIDTENNNVAVLGDIESRCLLSPDWKFLLST